MSYDYSSESKLLELPNPYRLQNRLLWLVAALLLLAGVTSLFWARDALQGQVMRGAKQMQFVRLDGRWWIAALAWDDEREGFEPPGSLD